MNRSRAIPDFLSTGIENQISFINNNPTLYMEKLIKFGTNQTERKEDLDSEKIKNIFDPIDYHIENNGDLLVTRKARAHQGLFRNKLLKWFDNQCAVTGITTPEVLRASHIKPFSECQENEKYDIKNGLILSADFDALFDKELISFDETGTLVYSEKARIVINNTKNFKTRLDSVYFQNSKEFLLGHYFKYLLHNKK